MENLTNFDYMAIAAIAIFVFWKFGGTIKTWLSSAKTKIEDTVQTTVATVTKSDDAIHSALDCLIELRNLPSVVGNDEATKAIETLKAIALTLTKDAKNG